MNFSIFIKRPIMATMIIMAMIVFGLFSFLELGVDLFPKIEFPNVIITTDLTGASPEEVETEITKRIEEAVNTISGIDELISYSYEGRSQIVTQFVLEKDVNVAAQEVRDRINRVLNDLPEGTKTPVVEKFDFSGAPIVQVVVSGDMPMREMAKLVRKRVKENLETVQGVGDIRIVGTQEREIHLVIDPARLSGHGLTASDIETALRKQNLEMPGGFITEEPRELIVRTMGRIMTAADFGAIPIDTFSSTPVLIRDVAEVQDTDEEVRSLSRFNGQPCVSLSIRKQSDANTVKVAKSIIARVDEMKATIPGGLTIRVVQDQSRFIMGAVKSLEEDIILGAILVALTVFIFMKDLRGMLICAVSIPSSLIATFTLMRLQNFTLNNLTLLALSLATGIVIDDAIIVLENIYRHMEEKGQSPLEAAQSGLAEIAPAVISTTLSLMVIFIPLAFMNGIIGRFMFSFGMTMAFSIAISLCVAFVLTPMLCSRFLKAKDQHAKSSKDSRLMVFLDTRYTKMLKWALSHRKISVIVAIFIMFSTIPSIIFVGKDFVPRDDRSEFAITIKSPEGTSIAEMDKILKSIEDRVRKIDGVSNLLTTIGGGDSKAVNEASIFVKLVGIKERDHSQKEIMGLTREALAGLPTLRTSVMDSGGAGAGHAPFQVRITGPDLNKLMEYADNVLAKMKEKEGFIDSDTTLQFGKPEVRVNIDRQRAADLGVTISDVSRAIQLLVSGSVDITKFKVLDELYQVRMKLSEKYKKSSADLMSIPIPAAKEHRPMSPIRLDQIASIEETTGPSRIERYMRQRSIEVGSDLVGLATSEAKSFIESQKDKLGITSDYHFEFVGMAKIMKEMQMNFLTAFLLSVIFMYMILASLFESWLHPITILASLPLAFPFAILSLLIAGQTLHIISILGLFLLIGIVKKNAILQVDYTNTLRKGGMERNIALVEASRTRLRPIMMTTFTLIASMIPVALSRGEGSATRAPMAVVIIGGQSLCLLVTLLLTPVFYTIMDDLQIKHLPRWKQIIKARIPFWK